MVFDQIISIMGTACLPVLELKAAIIAGFALGFPIWETFLFSYLGSIIPVPIILKFSQPVMAKLRNTKQSRKFIDWVEARSLKKSNTIKKYSLVGLFIFVAIPLPTTGVWTGSLIAALVGLRFWPSVAVIFSGNFVAGMIMTGMTYGLL